MNGLADPLRSAGVLRKLASPHLAAVVLALASWPGFPRADPASVASAILRSPDVAFNGTYEIPCRPAVLDSLLRRPIFLAKLWTSYGFAPSYRAREQGTGLHVEDPTGIAGDITLVRKEGSRWVFLGDGALNHRLVPAFTGKLAIALTTGPGGAGTRAVLEVAIKAESRGLGLLAWTLSPLVRGRIENRVSANLRDLSLILKDVSRSPRQVAARLPAEDVPAFTRMFPVSGEM